MVYERRRAAIVAGAQDDELVRNATALSADAVGPSVSHLELDLLYRLFLSSQSMPKGKHHEI